MNDPRLLELTKILKDGLARMTYTSREQAYAEALRSLAGITADDPRPLLTARRYLLTKLLERT